MLGWFQVLDGPCRCTSSSSTWRSRTSWGASSSLCWPRCGSVSGGDGQSRLTASPKSEPCGLPCKSVIHHTSRARSRYQKCMPHHLVEDSYGTASRMRMSQGHAVSSEIYQSCAYSINNACARGDRAHLAHNTPLAMHWQLVHCNCCRSDGIEYRRSKLEQ